MSVQLDLARATAYPGLGLMVGIVAPPPLDRRVAGTLTRSGVVVVGRAPRPAQLVAACAERQPHVVVLASGSGPSDDATAVRLLSARMPRSRIIVILPEHNRAEVRAALRIGVDGVVLDAQLALALPVVVGAVALGHVSIPRELRGELDDEALSSRQMEVLALVAEGLPNAAIAGRLCLAESTVKSHLSSAFSKLGVHTREEAAALMREQYLPPGFDDPSKDGHGARVVNGGNT